MPLEMEDRGRALENEYFRRKEHELIERLRAKIKGEGSTATGMQCPRCDGKLFETEFEKIKIDVCDTCSGVWFDAGELAQVIAKDENKGFFHKLFG